MIWRQLITINLWNPDFARAYYNRAILYHKQGKNDLAKIDLEKSKELFSRQGDMTLVDKVNDVLDRLIKN